MRERQATFPSLFNSGVVTETPAMDEIASGAGTSANVPFFKDITDQTDEIQVENTAPTTDNTITTGLQVVPILNRVTKNSATALASAVSGEDAVAQIIDQLVARRLKQRQSVLLATLRGLFNTPGTVNAAAPLSGARYGGTTAEIFLEAGASPAAGQMVSPDVFIYSKALLGELADDLAGGVLWVHPTVKARLESLDGLNFKTGKPSDLPFDITTYRGVPIFTSNALVRAGSTSGFVYDSYLIAQGRVGYGEKPQSSAIGDVASLVYWGVADKNNEEIYDRTRFQMLLSGTKWVGTPAGQSATNAELQTPANWNLVYSSAARCGAVCFRTNG